MFWACDNFRIAGIYGVSYPPTERPNLGPRVATLAGLRRVRQSSKTRVLFTGFSRSSASSCQVWKWSPWPPFLDVIRQEYIKMSYWIANKLCDKIVKAGNYKALQLHCFHVLPFCWNTELLVQFFHHIFLELWFQNLDKTSQGHGMKTNKHLGDSSKSLMQFKHQSEF